MPWVYWDQIGWVLPFPTPILTATTLVPVYIPRPTAAYQALVIPTLPSIGDNHH